MARNTELVARNEELVARNKQLEDEVAALRERAGRSSRNSSLPPSKDPPDAPARSARNRSGRRQGAQPGHRGVTRELVAPELVNETLNHYPPACSGCERPFGEDERETLRRGDPERRQQYELPRVIVWLTEHRLHCLGCPACGQSTRAKGPATLASGLLGPRFCALVVLLSVAHRVGRRGVTALCAQLCGLPGLSTATIQRAIEQTSAALQDVHAQVAQALRSAPVSFMDETGWRQRGARRWIWARFTGTLAVFTIAGARSRDVAKALLGELEGIITTDRYSAYNYLPLKLRQICLAHILRDCARFATRAGPAGPLGEALIELFGQVFERWHNFTNHQDRERLKRELGPIQQAIHSAFELARDDADAKTAKTAANILALWPALWTFVTVPGAEPTNNGAERGLRPAVIYRKTSLGTQSDAGSRALERALTAIETCRRQGRDPLAYLTDALTAHHNGQPAPSPLAA